MNESWLSLTITHRMYGWSKWGGAREGLVKEDLDVWYCQSCGEKQLRILPSYMFPVDELGRDFVRVCSLCKAKSIIKKLSKFGELLRLIR
jgi:hypothetical protein